MCHLVSDIIHVYEFLSFLNSRKTIFSPSCLQAL